MYLDLSIWLDEMTAKYSFAEAGETLRHLVFLANGGATPPHPHATTPPPHAPTHHPPPSAGSA